MVTIKEMGYWKDKLYDSSKRNKLLNCVLPESGKRISKNSLLISEPGPEQLWTLLNDMKSKAVFNEKQPEYRYFPIGNNKADVFIYSFVEEVTDEMVEEIKRQIKMYCELRFSEEELEYLHNIKWIKGSYCDFLRLWQPRFEDFTFGTDAPCGLTIETRGTWLNTSMYEIPVLAIVNEVYFRMAYKYEDLIKERYSVRKFDSREVEDELLKPLEITNPEDFFVLLFASAVPDFFVIFITLY